jgi:hypothetical protein
MEEESKQPNVTCFNCVEFGHFSTDCKAPRSCFICQTASHAGRDCPDWYKHLEPAQYLGSAAQGLGFFHVDVQEEEDFIEANEIVANLQMLFDKN